jgi:3-phosphoshikimate 1-carboxyvinyltransferase
MSNQIFVWSPPGSKSITNRAVVMAGMSRSPTKIKNFLLSDDTLVGIENLKKLGFDVQTKFDVNPHVNEVCIVPPDFHKLNQQNFYDQIFELNMGQAGTMARFFPAVILNWTKTFPESKPICVRFDASEQLRKRPINPLFDALKILGAQIVGETYPYDIRSSNLVGNVDICTEQSSQFLSGLLFAAAGSKNDVKITRTSYLPQPDYVLMTLDCLQKFNLKNMRASKLEEFEFFANDEQTLKCAEFFVEPDASTACYFLALAFIRNIAIKINGLGTYSLQPDVLFCNFLSKMGAHIQLQERSVTVHQRSSPCIKGGFEYDFSEMSDQALTAGVLALFADDAIEISGVSHIRHHESDRIRCFVQNLKSLGLHAYEKTDGFIVSKQLQPLADIKGIWETHDDHRFAMSGFLLSVVYPGIKIANQHCVTKTAPTFFDDMMRVLAF